MDLDLRHPCRAWMGARHSSLACSLALSEFWCHRMIIMIRIVSHLLPNLFCGNRAYHKAIKPSRTPTPLAESVSTHLEVSGAILDHPLSMCFLQHVCGFLIVSLFRRCPPPWFPFKVAESWRQRRLLRAKYLFECLFPCSTIYVDFNDVDTRSRPTVVPGHA